MTTASIGSLLDHYKIIEELGHGGMGVVYKALNIHLDKIVAIKTITLGLSSHENFINRFQTEARALAKLEDPNIVRIYDLRVDDNQWYIVMEYVEGGTLADRIRGNKPIPHLSALPIMKQLLNAIGHAHRVGIIHRDIKPNNVMITRDGIVKVTDFGLAKDQHHHNNTIAGSTGGTLYYMSPEQVKGLFFTDHRSDIYSLGLTFYEMLAGKIPFRKDDTDFAIREAIIKRQFPPPSQFNPKIPVALNSIVMRAIEKDPDQRFQGVNEMLESLLQFERQESIWAPATPKVTYNPDSLQYASKIDIPPDTQMISYQQTAPSKKSIVSKLKWVPAGILLLLIIWLGFTYLPLKQDSETEQLFDVTIRSNPDAALVIANGDTLGRTPLFHARFPQGKISLLVQKENFVTLDTILRIEPRSATDFSLSLLEKSVPGAEEVITTQMRRPAQTATTGKIRVKTIPPGASVYQDGTYIGVSPITDLELRGGAYLFRFDKKGYATQSRRIQITPGERENLSVTLATKTISLRIESNPAGAEIFLNGASAGGLVTPAEIDQLAPGTQHIALKKKGFITYETDVELKLDRTNIIEADLAKANASVRLLVKPWGTIYIDKVKQKENTNVTFSETLEPGRHLVTVTHPSYGTWEKNIDFSAGITQDLVVDFSQTVNVRITAFDTEGKPIWADILVDNEPTGNMTPKEIAVRIGHRTFSAHKDGYELVGGSMSVMLDKSLQEPLKFILRRTL